MQRFKAIALKFVLVATGVMVMLVAPVLKEIADKRASAQVKVPRPCGEVAGPEKAPRGN